MQPIAIFVRDHIYHHVHVKAAEERFLNSRERLKVEEQKVSNQQGVWASMRWSHCQWTRCEKRNETDLPLQSSEIHEIRRDRFEGKTWKTKKRNHRHNWPVDEPFRSDRLKVQNDQRVKVIHPVNFFTDALGVRTYRLVNRDQTYRDRLAQRISRMQKCLKVHMRDQVFDASSLFTSLSFLKTFKTACDWNGISKGAKIKLMHFFMKKPSNDAISSRLQIRFPRL